jgi:hypothetical protein
MLRIEFQNDVANATTIRMEGRLVGTFAEDARELVARCKIPSKVVVNLSEVSFVDSIGEETLSCLGRIGVKFVAESAYARDVCDRLKLPVLRKRSRSLPGML